MERPLDHSIGAVPSDAGVSLQMQGTLEIANLNLLRCLELAEPAVAARNISDEIVKMAYRSLLTPERKGVIIAFPLKILLKSV